MEFVDERVDGSEVSGLVLVDRGIHKSQLDNQVLGSTNKLGVVLDETVNINSDGISLGGSEGVLVNELVVDGEGVGTVTIETVVLQESGLDGLEGVYGGT